MVKLDIVSFNSAYRSALLLLLTSLILGCCNIYPSKYINSENGENIAFSEYSVNSEEFSNYRLEKEYIPPLLQDKWTVKGIQQPILPSDIWRVTHKYPGGYIIYSESYKERQCKYYAENQRNPRAGTYNIFRVCIGGPDYAVNITNDGSVFGWTVKQGVTGYSNRCSRYINPSAYLSHEWEDSQRFLPINPLEK